MKGLTLVILLILFSTGLGAQTRKELEEQRKKTLEEISYVDNVLQETTKEKSSGLNELRIIGNKLTLRENVISGMRDEINLLTDRIALNTLAIELMEKDLVILKRDYARTIINSYKSSRGNPDLAYLLSARDFNQGYKRLRYLQQVTKFRRRESEIISELRDQIERTKKKQMEDLYNISDLKGREEIQKSLLQQEQDKKRKLVNSLANKERQLRKELDEKKRIAQKIEAEIARVIDEERKKSISTQLTPEQRLIGDNFSDNKGRLPWPVEKGVVTSQFGLQQHPILAYVMENNIGVEITSSGKTQVRSIFKGQVVRVFPISGANMAIIIRHGKFLSVYQNLINVKVRPGDNVETKQEIGELFIDKENGSKAVLSFMIFEEKEMRDPELWIAKK
jgi:septal ring factor EnvC (AmiA/AmiB activator)